MNSDFFEALALLEQEKGIPKEYLVEKIKNAISIAVKRDVGGTEDNVVEILPEEQRFYVAVNKYVVDEVENPSTEILREEAKGNPVIHRYSEIDPSEQKMHANHIRDHILEEGTEMAQFYYAHFSSLWDSKDS